MKSTPLRLLIGVGTIAALLYLASKLINVGLYGWTVFIIVPLCAGSIVSYIVQPATAWQAVKVGALTGLLGSCFFLVLGAEGLFCVLLAAPLLAPVTTLGSWLTYKITKGIRPTTPAGMAFLLPLSLFFDTHAHPAVYQVTTRMVVSAPPARVWEHVVAFPDIPDMDDWLQQTGFAFPKRTRIEGAGVGAKRYCDLSTGPVIERVTIWDKPHILRFTVTSTPPCMREEGLYGPIETKHLNGYFISKQGQFVLTPLAGGRTLVEGTSWYQHGLWPAQYWRWWSDAVIHRIHQTVLNHIRTLSERQS